MLTHTPVKPEVFSEELSIVLLGDFNPKIFQPTWFALQGLIRESEAETAPVELVHSDYTSFSTDWFALQVTRDKFNLTVKSLTYKKHLTDLALGTFQKLSHTPINAMGLNISKGLRFKSVKDWHGFGHYIAPKSPWNGLLKNPGTRSIMIESQRDNDFPGYNLITIDPVTSGSFDANVRINNHYVRRNDDVTNSIDFFAGIIEQQFNDVINVSCGLVEGLLTNFIKNSQFDDGMNS